MRLRLGYTSQPVPDDAPGIGPFGKNWRGSYESLIGSFGFFFIFMKVAYISLPLGQGPFKALSLLLMQWMGVR